MGDVIQKYDKREVFVLPDGGKIHIDYLGKSFQNIEKLKAAL